MPTLKGISITMQREIPFNKNKLCFILKRNPVFYSLLVMSPGIFISLSWNGVSLRKFEH